MKNKKYTNRRKCASDAFPHEIVEDMASRIRSRETEVREVLREVLGLTCSGSEYWRAVTKIVNEEALKTGNGSLPKRFKRINEIVNADTLLLVKAVVGRQIACYECQMLFPEHELSLVTYVPPSGTRKLPSPYTGDLYLCGKCWGEHGDAPDVAPVPVAKPEFRDGITEPWDGFDPACPICQMVLRANAENAGGGAHE